MAEDCLPEESTLVLVWVSSLKHHRGCCCLPVMRGHLAPLFLPSWGKHIRQGSLRLPHILT